MPAGKYDLVSVAAHEICHGLNFSGSASYSGGTGSYGYSGSPYIYDTFIENSSGTKLTAYANPSTALGSHLTSGSLWFNGTNAKAANGGTRVKIYAPSTWSSGSSYSHLDYSTFAGTANSMMVYAIGSGSSQHNPGAVTKGLLKDLGWVLSGSTTTVPTPQSPSGTISDMTPTFTWSKVTGATQYNFVVYTGSTQVYTKTVPASACGTSTCSNTPTTGLSSGAHTWKVRAYVSGAWKAYSASKSFTISTAKPVLVDNAHSNAYSIATGYVTWKTLLASNGYTVTQTTSSITSSQLSGKKVFVALMPQSYYTTSEKNALKTWVNNGGSLMIIGDLYRSGPGNPPWAKPSNDLSTFFGISFRDIDFARDNTNYESPYNQWIYLYPRNYTTFGSIMTGIGTTEIFAAGPLASTTGSAVIKLDADAVPSGANIVMARTLGSGRVIVLGDSNFWSDPDRGAKCINSHDNKKFALRAISWLATGTAAGSDAFVDVNSEDLMLTPPANQEFDPAMPQGK